MRRREFFTVLGTAALAWKVPVSASDKKRHTVGFLWDSPSVWPDTSAKIVADRPAVIVAMGAAAARALKAATTSLPIVAFTSFSRGGRLGGVLEKARRKPDRGKPHHHGTRRQAPRPARRVRPLRETIAILRGKLFVLALAIVWPHVGRAMIPKPKVGVLSPMQLALVEKAPL
jgi:hypothetical protein